MERTKFSEKKAKKHYKKKVNGKNATGRPSSYKESFCKQIIDYFSNAPLYDEVLIPHYKKDKLVWEDVKRFPAKLPTLVQFAKHIGVNVCTVDDWQNEESPRYQPDFSKAYKYARKLQKDFLIQAGLSGLFHAGFAQFVAVNLTDMQNKSATEFNANGPLVNVVENKVGVNVVNIDSGEITKAIAEAAKLGLAPELFGSFIDSKVATALPTHSNL